MATRHHLSNAVIRDHNDRRNPGAKFYFFEQGTTTPLVVYADPALTTPINNSAGAVVADASGRLPTIYIPYIDGFKERLVLSSGVVDFENDNVPNPAPTASGGGGGGGDANAQAATGDLWPSFIPGTRPGWVRANGSTIGNASSSALERANADTQALFEFLWNNYSNTFCAVSGGRGASAAADFAANKTITLFNMQGRVPVGTNGMGGTAANLLNSVAFTLGAQGAAGSRAGVALHTLTAAEMPVHGHTATVSDPGHLHTQSVTASQGNYGTGPSTASSPPSTGNTGVATTGITVSIGTAGSGQAHPIVQPSLVVNYFIKL